MAFQLSNLKREAVIERHYCYDEVQLLGTRRECAEFRGCTSSTNNDVQSRLQVLDCDSITHNIIHNSQRIFIWAQICLKYKLSA